MRIRIKGVRMDNGDDVEYTADTTTIDDAKAAASAKGVLLTEASIVSDFSERPDTTENSPPHELSYATPDEKTTAGSSGKAFWLTFAGTGVLGSFGMNIVDEIARRRHGHFSDGSMFLIGIELLVPIAIILACFRATLRRYGLLVPLAAGLLPLGIFVGYRCATL
jgi:hypothetical protein